MAKSNGDLGFAQIEWASGDMPGPYTVTLDLGRRGNQWRIYGYVWCHNQDASREGVRRSISARGTSPDDAIRILRAKAAKIDGWPSSAIEEAWGEIEDALAEMTE